MQIDSIKQKAAWDSTGVAYGVEYGLQTFANQLNYMKLPIGNFLGIVALFADDVRAYIDTLLHSTLIIIDNLHRPNIVFNGSTPVRSHLGVPLRSAMLSGVLLARQQSAEHRPEL